MNTSNDTGNRTQAEWAAAYREREWSPIPLKFEDKAPESNNWQNQTFTDEQLPKVFTERKNIGIVLGSRSRNLLDVDLDDPATVKLAPFFLTQTGCVFGRPSKPNSHFLYYVDPNEVLRRVTYYDPDGTLLLEIRGEGHQTMAANSIHPTGEQLEWAIFQQPALTTVDKLMTRAGFTAAAAMLGRHWHEWDSRRHAITMHLSGALLHAGITVDNVKEFVRAVCLIGGEDDWADREKAVDSTAEKLEAGENVTGFPKLTEVIGTAFVRRIIEWLKITTSKDRPSNTDEGNAQRLVSRHGKNLRHNKALGGWFDYDGKRFRQDDKAVVERMKDTARSILDEAKAEKNNDESIKLTKWSAQSRNAPKIRQAISLAESDPAVSVHEDAFDRDPWLLNVANGTVNLRTGGLQPHDPRDLITKIADIPYDPNAECPLWRDFLKTIQGGDEEMTDFLQKLAGYSLTGMTTEQVFMLMWGPPGTGKSTFIETLRRVFGDYAMNTETETFTAQRKSGRASPEIAKLQGARLVTASESEQGQRLAVARLKHMTGGDTVTASNLYAAPFDFTPVLKLWFSTNHKPRVPADEGGIWDRMILLPFEVNMRDSPDRIKDMKEQLARELPGILSWAVEGCLKWQEDGLGNRPARSTDAQAEYRNESDEVGDFLEQMTTRGPDFKAPAGQMYQSYKGWALNNGFRPLDVKRFKEKMLSRGFESKPFTVGTFWVGLHLNPTVTGVDDDSQTNGQTLRRS